jgi:hypothetical protein
VQDAIDEQRARFLVEFILHRLPANGHFDDDVEAFGRIVPVGMRSMRIGSVLPCWWPFGATLLFGFRL